MDRRTLLRWLAALPLVGGAGVFVLLRRPSRRQSLRALVDTLLPAGDGPGALLAGADAFVAHELLRPHFAVFAHEVEIGLARLDAAARARFGAESFAELGVAERDALLRAAGGAADTRFVQVVLTLTLEGMLSDPAHGGNLNGAGWKLIGYAPRHPRGSHGR